MKTLLPRILNRLFKMFYMPVCRVYARCILGNEPADRVMRILCSVDFYRINKYWPNFIQPRRFYEKVWYRQLYERNQKFTMISDKFRVRDYVIDKVGSNYLIPLLWHGDEPEDIPFDKLPQKFVIKANHGCGYNIIVQKKSQLDIPQVKKQLKKWLNENFCQDKFLGTEWAYRNIKPHIIIEAFLEENGKAPLDYKLFCFSGRMEFFKIDFDRFEGHSEVFFDKKLNRLDLFEYGLKRYQGQIDLPHNFDKIIRVAESLSAEFDFIRVDLYNVGDKIYFGELTCYPSGGTARFVPEEYDFIFGKKWKIRDS